MSVPLARHTVSPVTQFDAHELTTSGVGMSGGMSAPPSRTIRCTPVGPPVHVPAGRYAVTPRVSGMTDIDPVGGPHATGLLPVHAPAWQVSVWVQASPSLHDVPSGAAGLEQAPVAGSHVPATWQASAAVHVTGLCPVHVPARHESDWVQALLSSQ